MTQSLSVSEIAALVVCLLPLVPPARVLSQEGARRRLMAFAHFVWRGLGLGAIYVGGLIGLVVVAPRWLPPVALLVLVGAAVEAWRGRSDYGRSKDLPPGSLRFGQVEPWRNQRFYQDQVDRFGPVFKTRVSPRPLIGVYGLERARRLLQEHDAALGPGEPLPFHRLIPGGFLRYMDREGHDALEQRLRHAFSAEVMVGNRAAIAERIRCGLSTMAAEDDPTAESVVELLFPVFCGMFFGIWSEDRMAELRREYDAIDLRYTLLRSERRARLAVEHIEATLATRAASLNAKPAPTPSVLGNLVREDRSVVADAAVLRNLIFLLMTGWLDVAGLHVWLLKMLSDNPEVVEELRAEAEQAEALPGPPLALCALREAVRLEQSEFLSRTVLETFEFEGLRFPEGWRIRILEHENHRNPELFERPDEFWPRRFREAPPDPSVYAPFGASRIRCMGEHMTLGIRRACHRLHLDRSR